MKRAILLFPKGGIVMIHKYKIFAGLKYKGVQDKKVRLKTLIWGLTFDDSEPTFDSDTKRIAECVAFVDDAIADFCQNGLSVDKLTWAGLFSVMVAKEIPASELVKLDASVGYAYGTLPVHQTNTRIFRRRDCTYTDAVGVPIHSLTVEPINDSTDERDLEKECFSLYGTWDLHPKKAFMQLLIDDRVVHLPVDNIFLATKI